MEIPEFINDFRKMRKMGGGKQMKLGILCTMINGFGRRGYYNSQEIGLGRALARKGHEVMIYKGIDPSEKEEKVQVEKNLTIWYLPMKHLGAHGFMDCKYLDPQLKALFCFGDQQIFLPHVYRWCRRRRIPFVAYVGTAHSLDSNFKSKVMNALFAAGTLRIYKKNPVLAKTSAAKEELRQLGVPHAVIAPVGLDTAVLKKNIPADEKMRLRKEHGFEADDVILCNVSRLSWEKRPLELIDLFLQVKGKKKFKLIIVGNGPLEEELNEKIRKNGLEKEVKIYPNVPYEKMWEIYEMSDYYLNMNKGEIFGMAIMEAVYYKTSVAAIRALGPSVTLKDMKGHKLCENDDEMAEWITGPYPSEKDLQESSEKMASTFTWDRCADAFLQASSEKSSR
ncbi:glycosyltransferase [Clostridium sp. AM32-2]|jgi:glycosyltransferase involved in cell wall biosynthesis|nr:glycosyltransferase [Clostridium sp. AM32-2]